MSDSTAPKVRCQGCGLLGMRWGPASELVEVEEKRRESGDMPAEQVGGLLMGKCPVCAGGVPEFADDIAHLGGLATITKERDCTSFVKWRRGLSPGWHQQMIANQELRDWQQQESEKVRAWQERMDAAREGREIRRAEQEREREEKRIREERRWLLITTAVGAIIGAIATLVATLLSRP